ncbi:ATPase [Marasmius sp. AFHP31]|nr:ATPase [Marasmius sp. AFHP31]
MYHNLINSGTLRGDQHQTRIIQKLQDLHDQLLDYTPPSIPEDSPSSLFSRIFQSTTPTPTSPPPDAPKGLYLYGDVGTGKTMLMDMFYTTLPPNVTRKRRVHFHAFMIDVHKRLHAAKLAMGYKGGDPIVPVARDLAREAYVLCFDEFQVTDIADAMILRRLLESLLNYGVVCVMTSNRHPDELYKNGIQRSSFVPAIELLKSQFLVTDLDSGTDYRRIPRALSKVYYDPLTPETRREVDKIFTSITKDEEVVRNRPLKIWGRELLVPQSTSQVAKFKFEELCGKPLSAADYLEVTKTFGTVFVTDIPKMGMDQKDKARRFITFIDACYESKTKLFVSSEVPVYQIFSDESDDSKPISDHMRSVMDDLGVNEQIIGSSSIFTGEEEVFAFARACSRLVQMGSKEWAETAGLS